MFYSKPLLSLSFFLVLFFPSPPSFRQLWIENKLARHVSRHNHRALSGMIKFSTARLTEFPSGGERSPESERRENARRKEESCIHYRGFHWFFPTLLSRPNFAFNDAQECVRPRSRWFSTALLPNWKNLWIFFDLLIGKCEWLVTLKYFQSNRSSLWIYVSYWEYFLRIQ